MRLAATLFLTASLSCTACAQSESKAQDVVGEPAEKVVEESSESKRDPELDNMLKKAFPELVELRKQKSAKTEEEHEADLIAYRQVIALIDHQGIRCEGVFQQGGAALCETLPNSTVEFGGVKTQADNKGYFVIGFDRDAPKQETLNVHVDEKNKFSKTIDITPREYDVQRIDGLPPSQVSTFTEKQLAHIKASSARKKVGFSSRSKDMGFRDGFTMAVTGTKSSDFGNQRILNGEAKRPHYGVDIAAPAGTPIYAPADGVVSLADDDLYFEGAMVLVDHGQGLISMYLHMSEIDVEVGQKVKRGDLLGAVGAKGRATGSHLCWRLKWRNRNLDPELLTQWPHDD